MRVARPPQMFGVRRPGDSMTDSACLARVSSRSKETLMDLSEAKSRIAEALVESIFRRARYDVAPYKTDQSLLRFGREDFSPAFRVEQRVDGEDRGYLLAVKYRPSAEQFISVENQRGGRYIYQMI